MADLIEIAASWQSFIVVLIVFGTAPGAVLRLLLLAYPKADPRRNELLAELRTVPHIERPLWVAEQAELAVFEGLAARLKALLKSHKKRKEGKAGPPGIEPPGSYTPGSIIGGTLTLEEKLQVNLMEPQGARPLLIG